MSVYQEITYSLIDKEYIILNATGDERGRLFHLAYYPIRDFALSPNIGIFVKRNNTDIQLTEDQDYLVDLEESAIILITDLIEGDVLYIVNYMYENVYYAYMKNIRSILGDTDHKTFIYTNKDILEALHSSLHEILGNEASNWDIDFDSDLNRITNYFTDYRLHYLAGFSALRLYEASLRRKFQNAIYIKDGPTTIDTTKTVEDNLKDVSRFKQELNYAFQDELTFGEKSTVMLGMVDNIQIYIAGDS